MKGNEAEYFRLFLYTLILYWIVFAGMVSFFKLVNRKLSLYGILLILAITLLDGVTYGSFSFKWVTFPRKNIKFEEKGKGFFFPFQRKKSIPLPLDSQFRYFIPPLHGEFTALDTTNLTYFERKSIQARLDIIAEKVMDGEWLPPGMLQDTLVDFIMNNREEFDDWEQPYQLAYLNILELAIEHLFAEILFSTGVSTFISLLVSKEYRFLAVLRRCIQNGYYSVKNKLNWQKKEEAINLLRRLIKESEMNKLLRVLKLQKVFSSVIYSWHILSVADYIIYLKKKYQLKNVNTFVQFKDYKRLIKIFSPNEYHTKLPIIRKKLKEDMGITAPLIRFFPLGYFQEKESYFKELKAGLLKKEILYLHKEKIENVSVVNIKNKQPFFYQVVEYNPNYLKLLCEAHNSGFLYFSDGYDQYWQAKVNGEYVPVYPANGCFKAIKIPAGRCQVEFIYNPIFFRLSLWIYYSVGGGLLFFLWKKHSSCGYVPSSPKVDERLD